MAAKKTTVDTTTWILIAAGYVALSGGLIWALWFREPKASGDST